MNIAITRKLAATTLALVLSNGVTTVHADGAAESFFNSAQVTQGLGLYRQFCQRCHGTELRNSGASTFDLRLFPAHEHERFVESVSEGSGDMPPHGDILTGEEIDALFAYVVATQRKKPS